MSHHGIAAPKNNSTWVQAHIKLNGGVFGRRSANGVTDMVPDWTFTNPHRGNKPPPPRLTSEPTWKDPFAQVGAFEPSLFNLLCGLTCSWRTCDLDFRGKLIYRVRFIKLGSYRISYTPGLISLDQCLLSPLKGFMTCNFLYSSYSAPRGIASNSDIFLPWFIRLINLFLETQHFEDEILLISKSKFSNQNLNPYIRHDIFNIYQTQQFNLSFFNCLRLLIKLGIRTYEDAMNLTEYFTHVKGCSKLVWSWSWFTRPWSLLPTI